MSERTLIILKPDAVQRRLVGRITSRFEEKGLKIIGLKLMALSSELVAEHYAPHKGKFFYDSLIKYLTSGPVVAMVLEGDGVIEMARRMMGSTSGAEAAAGTIRGDFATGNVNIIHGSDSEESAEREIKLFFDESELLSYKMPDEEWIFDSAAPFRQGI